MDPQILYPQFVVADFPNSINVSASGSNLRVQIQTDPRYFDFVDRARNRDVLGKELPVAAIEDILQGKIWAASDPQRLLDIERILETRPDLRNQVPAGILSSLET